MALNTPTAIITISTPNATKFMPLPMETAISSASTPTATIHPTRTQVPTPTPTETLVPPITPTLPPMTESAGDSAELYNLRPWSDVEASALVSLMTDHAEEILGDWELSSYYGDRGRKEIIEVGQEFILRYPNSPYRTNVEWQMVDASTYFPSKLLDEMLAKLIGADLNAGVTTLATLDLYLQTHGFQIGHNYCQGCVPFPSSIPNLLGDGRDIPLFPIERLTSHFDGGILLAIWQDTDEEFIVTPIISQWAATTRFSGGINNFEARYITGDSQPELLVELWGHSGTMLGTSLDMYKWNGEKFVQLAGTPFNFSSGIFADQWTFIEGDNPSRLQIVRAYNGMTTIYEWTGNSYEIVDEITTETIPPDPTDKFLASQWIQQETKRGNYTKVIVYLNEALQIPASDFDPFGTQYHHAMRFLLGINYVYLEDGEMARSIFEALRNEDLPPELVGFSQAAGAFLEQYVGLGSAYEGCKTAYEEILISELKINAWMPLCAFDKLFVEKLEQYKGVGSVFDYVDAAELIYSEQHDLNGDGQLDWLLALSHPTLSSQTDVEVWAVLLTDMGTEVVQLTTLWKTEKISVEIHSPFTHTSPLIAILSGNSFSLLQLMKDKGEWKTKLYVNNGTVTDYNLQMVENTLQLDLFIDVTTSYDGIDRITYRWDLELEEFVEISRHAPNSLGIPFNKALDSAETLILENGNFAAAIPILSTIVHEFKPVDYSGGRFSLLPRTLYLLGLAHEIQGNETQAVAAYWQLWHDYPTASYALIAATKLEKK